MMNLEWTATRGCLTDLIELLKCSICQHTVSKPVSLGGCEHFFCKICVDEVSQCPICCLPCHAKDIQTDRQLATAASLCKQLHQLLIHSNEASNDLVDRAIAGTSESPTLAEKENVSVFDMIGSPSTDSPSASVARRTRKGTKKSRRAKALNISNKVWNIGNKKMDRCHSCSGSKSLKVCFNDGCANKSPNLRMTRKRKSMENGTDWAQSAEEEEGTSTVKSQVKEKMDRDLVDEASQPWVQVTPIKDTKLNQTVTTSVVQRGACTTPSSYGSATSNANAKGKKSKKSAAKGKGKAASSRTVITASPAQSKRVSKTSPRGLHTGVSSPQIVKKNSKGETPLQVAAIKGDLSKVKQLVNDGAPVNVKDNAGWTPLHEACNHGHYEVARLLLDHGAFVSIPGLDNDTPLHDAITNNKVNIVKLLVSRGASITARNAHGKTPADLAISGEMKRALQTPVDNSALQDTSINLSQSLTYNQIVILGTGLSREQKNNLQKCAQILHGKVVDEFSPEVTHVVSSTNKEGYCSRTIKNLRALMNGLWIVSYEWVNTCIEYNEKVCEEAFEVPGMSTGTFPHGPSRARLNREQQLPGLFDGFFFYLHGDFEYPAPQREDFIALLKSGGGTLLTREPKLETINQTELTVPYHSSPDGPLASCNYFKVCSDTNVTPKVNGSRLAVVSFNWIFNCVTNFKIMDI